MTVQQPGNLVGGDELLFKGPVMNGRARQKEPAARLPRPQGSKDTWASVGNDVPVARRLGRRLMPLQLGYWVKQIYVGH